MKSNLGARPASAINANSITTPLTEPVVGNNGQHTIVIQQVVEHKQESAITANLVLIAGILFWAHGSASHDAWFKGEEVTGQAITGFYIALIGLICCCGCCAAFAAADSHDSEVEVSPNEANRAQRFLTNSAPRQLMTDLFKVAAKAETPVDRNLLSYNV